MLKILTAVGVLVVIVGGLSAYLVGSAGFAARSAQADATAELQTIRAHTLQIDASLKVPNFDVSGSSPDWVKAKKEMDDYVARSDQATATIRADQGSLRPIDDRLLSRATGLAALPFRASLNNQRARVEAMLSALDAAMAGLAIEQGQVKTLAAAYDAFQDFGVLTSRLQKQDISGSLAVFPGLDAKLQKAVQLAQGPSNPPQIQKEMQALQTTSADMKSFLQAVQRRDQRAVLALQPKLDADTKALDSLDTSGVDAYERTLMQPYIDRYDSGMRAAGFTVKA